MMPAHGTSGPLWIAVDVFNALVGTLKAQFWNLRMNSQFHDWHSLPSAAEFAEHLGNEPLTPKYFATQSRATGQKFAAWQPKQWAKFHFLVISIASEALSFSHLAEAGTMHVLLQVQVCFCNCSVFFNT